LSLFAFLNLPNTQAFASLRKPKIHQKSKPFKNQALYGQTLFSKFDEQELTSLLKIIETATDTSLSFCSIGIERTMNIFNN